MTLTTRQQAKVEMLSRYIDRDNQYALEQITMGNLDRAQFYLDQVARSAQALRDLVDGIAAKQA